MCIRDRAAPFAAAPFADTTLDATLNVWLAAVFAAAAFASHRMHQVVRMQVVIHPQGIEIDRRYLFLKTIDMAVVVVGKFTRFCLLYTSRCV